MAKLVCTFIIHLMIITIYTFSQWMKFFWEEFRQEKQNHA